ncbi:LLM class flavin-dependent oxidoreductase [Amycolatopsis jejuensis]|uniref:LLM class flavin-dependent oxidoreductase n=1 Tax=Amycolatopsis jejuensis TaxID=330084 RepID=UPI00052772FE|nr:LLM class flavin-dependent oxidoreductase [Amycolatopsis jejuensis]
MPELGFLLGSTEDPAQIVATAKAAERAGVDELWLGEDYFFAGGIAAAGALLASTSLPVGIGIVPAVTRHPALLAMELATLAGIYPGRVYGGIGAGVPEWLDGMALRPKALLSSVRNTLRAVRDLHAGKTVTVEHETFAAQEIALHCPPVEPPPLYVGASGPKALAMSGAEADGSVLSVLTDADYVRWASEQIGVGGRPHRLVGYAFCAVDDDAEAARESLRELVGLYLLTGPRNAITQVQGIADQAEGLAELGLEEGTARIPHDLIDRLTIAGPAEYCAERIAELGAAGADAIVLATAPETQVEETIRAVARAMGRTT